MYDERNYLIINTEETDKINFDDVLETSVETLRYSLDGTKTFIKWDGDDPDFLNNLTFKDGPYSHQEILIILATEEWSSSEPAIPDTN